MNSEVLGLLTRSGIVPAAQNVVDCSVWTGTYPFRGIIRSTPADWAELAGRVGISRAIAAPFEAVFQENSLDAYARAADEFAGNPHIEVWPVLRPGALHGIGPLLDRYRPRGLRLVPTYHDYHLYDTSVQPIMGLARERGMVVQIFTRLSDERWHWIVKVPELSMHEIEYAISAYAEQPILVSGLNRPQALTSRFKQHQTLYADISRIRGPVFAIEQLAAAGSTDRLVFGSLWPVQILEATLWQVTSARIDASVRDAILRTNVTALLH